MEPLAADFDLPFEAGEVVLGVGEVSRIFSQHHQAFDGLGQQKLMVKRNIRSSVLKGKNNPYSQGEPILG